MNYGIYLLSENLNTEHFTFTSELYNSAMGGSYLLWGRIFKIINWFSVSPWVVHVFQLCMLPVQAARPVNTHHVREEIIRGRKQKKEKKKHSGIPF